MIFQGHQKAKYTIMWMGNLKEKMFNLTNDQKNVNVIWLSSYQLLLLKMKNKHTSIWETLGKHEVSRVLVGCALPWTFWTRAWQHERGHPLRFALTQDAVCALNFCQCENGRISFYLWVLLVQQNLLSYVDCCLLFVFQKCWLSFLFVLFFYFERERIFYLVYSWNGHNSQN